MKHSYQINNAVAVYVELLDEGTTCYRLTEATDEGNELYKLLPTPNYDSGDESWAFLPGEIVRIEDIKSPSGDIKVARHSNPDVVRISVEQEEGGAFWVKTTNALSIGNGLYEVLPTPHYNPTEEKWKFPPGSIVRLKEITLNGFKYIMATEA